MELLTWPIWFHSHDDIFLDIRVINPLPSGVIIHGDKRRVEPDDGGDSVGVVMWSATRGRVWEDTGDWCVRER